MPKKKKWGRDDLLHYKNWYYMWIEYIDKKLSFSKHLPKVPNVLEIGSGIGGVSALLSDKDWDVTGSDISREMVSSAQATNKNVHFIFCDVQERIPGGYDAIFGFEVLEHIPKPEKAIRNIHDALKKGGYFIGSTPFPYPKNFTDPTHCSVLYPKEWTTLFKKAHFKNITTYPISFFPFLWRIHKKLNIILPFYIPFPGFVSTTLLIGEK